MATELDKWAEARDDFIKLEAFLEWAYTHGYIEFTRKEPQKGILEYCQIDPAKLEQERRVLLAAHREKHDA